MGSAAAIECSVHKNGTITMMGRIVNDAGSNINQASVDTVEYTVNLLDADYPGNPDTRTAVTGHSAVAVADTACVFDTLQTGAPWTVDDTGYNFKWTIDIGTQAFTIAGRKYMVEWTITPTSGQPIRFDFLVECK